MTFSSIIIKIGIFLMTNEVEYIFIYLVTRYSTFVKCLFCYLLFFLLSLLLIIDNKGFPGGSDGKESTCDAADLGSVPGLGRPAGVRRGNPLLYS